MTRTCFMFLVACFELKPSKANDAKYGIGLDWQPVYAPLCGIKSIFFFHMEMWIHQKHTADWSDQEHTK